MSGIVLIVMGLTPILIGLRWAYRNDRVLFDSILIGLGFVGSVALIAAGFAGISR